MMHITFWHKESFGCTQIQQTLFDRFTLFHYQVYLTLHSKSQQLRTSWQICMYVAVLHFAAEIQR